MIDHHYVYLKDQYGNPIKVDRLPRSIAEMTDDPYRSLSGSVRDQGGFIKAEGAYFIEFDWALYFRQNLKDIDLVSNHGYKDAVKRATKLAHSSASSEMPGFTPVPYHGDEPCKGIFNP